MRNLPASSHVSKPLRPLDLRELAGLWIPVDELPDGEAGNEVEVGRAPGHRLEVLSGTSSQLRGGGRHGDQPKRNLSRRARPGTPEGDQGGRAKARLHREVTTRRQAKASTPDTAPASARTNGKVERFIKTSLLEWAYARVYRHSDERRRALAFWLHHYNWHRPHTSLGGR